MQIGWTTEVMFVCPKCGMAYSAVQERSAVERSKIFNCMDCNAQVLGWLGDFNYHSWKQVTMRAVKFGKRGLSRTRNQR
jgi:predicted RNA-binding Zn-ribbon protein involved in translation (DUF1610 family)